MKILMIGSGGRESALLQACMASEKVREIIVVPAKA